MGLIYIDTHGEETPVENSQGFVAAIENGLIREDTLVRRDGEKTWKPAREFREFTQAKELASSFPPGLAKSPSASTNDVLRQPRVQLSGSTAQESIRRAAAARNFILVGCMLAWAGSMIDVYYVKTMEHLVVTYGWDQIPEVEYPAVGGDTFFKLHMLLRVSGYLIVWIAFFRSMFGVRDAASYFKPYKYKISKEAMVATMVMPLVNMIVPWLGVAEIRRSAISLSKPEHGQKFSWATLGLWLSFFLGAVLIWFSYRNFLTARPESREDMVNLANEITKYAVADSLVILVLSILFFTYCGSAIKYGQEFMRKKF